MARVDYATVAQVQALTWTFSATTTPTSTEVGAKLTKYHNFVDANIDNRYTTPVTDTEDIEVLNDIVLAFMVDWVYRCKYGIKDIPENVIAQKTEQRANLIEIKRGGIALKDTTQQNSTGLVEFNDNLVTAEDADFNKDDDTDDYSKDRY